MPSNAGFFLFNYIQRFIIFILLSDYLRRFPKHEGTSFFLRLCTNIDAQTGLDDDQVEERVIGINFHPWTLGVDLSTGGHFECYLNNAKNAKNTETNTGGADFWRPFGSEGMLRIVGDGHQDLLNYLALYEVVKS